jgi:protoporphyrinogen/coproporphyrinogen III oxidase
VVATPAHAAAQLVARLDSSMCDALSAIPHVSSATVSLAYPSTHVPRVLDGYGYVVPRREGRPVMASTWSSTKFDHRAPEGFALIRVFVGRSGAEDPLAGTDESLVELARAEVADVLGARRAPLLYRVFRWPNGMPQYTLGHSERVATIERQAQEHPGLFIAGNALHGVGIPDCIASGEAAAQAAAEYLRWKT